MNSTTLRGVFPEAKPVHRRNFVRENIKYLKDMQGYIQDANVTSQSQEIKPNKFQHVAPKVYSTMNARKRWSHANFEKRPLSFNQIPKSKRPPLQPFFKGSKNIASTITHKGVQTERPEDVVKLYETGNLKYPSPSVLAQFNNKPRKSTRDHGDASPQNLTKSMQKLDLEEKQNYIKQNIKNIKTNKQKLEEAPDPRLPPSNYQMGALPKYLKEKKDEKRDSSRNDAKSLDFEGDHLCGLVLLPDEERREYLRVARENYAALIKELNSMPMSNDTLKKRKRKMEIEDELKRLDEVIKIFQKPKVFVKADS